MTTNDIFGDVISSYTEEQAIADGVLAHPYPSRWPWLLITASVHGACEREAAKGQRTYPQCLDPLLMDCIMAAQKAQKSGAQPPIELEHTVAGTVWIMPNAKGGMTVMLPSDY